MSQSNEASAQNTFHFTNSSVENMTGSGDIHYGLASDRPLISDVFDEPKKVILFLAANPISTNRLRLDEEIREIEAGLRRSQYRDRFELQQRWAVRPVDLQRALLDCKPQIVHFSGHGIGRATAGQSIAPFSEDTREISFADSVDADSTEIFDEGVVLEDTTGQPKLVRTEALSALFKLFADSVECVVLNACYSEQQAKAIAQYTPYVIGMNQAIGDRAAIEFAVGFYDALGAGESIEQAHRFGIVALQLSDIPEHLTPVLLERKSG